MTGSGDRHRVRWVRRVRGALRWGGQGPVPAAGPLGWIEGWRCPDKGPACLCGEPPSFPEVVTGPFIPTAIKLWAPSLLPVWECTSYLLFCLTPVSSGPLVVPEPYKCVAIKYYNIKIL